MVFSSSSSPVLKGSKGLVAGRFRFQCPRDAAYQDPVFFLFSLMMSTSGKIYCFTALKLKTIFFGIIKTAQFHEFIITIIFKPCIDAPPDLVFAISSGIQFIERLFILQSSFLNLYGKLLHARIGQGSPKISSACCSVYS